MSDQLKIDELVHMGFQVEFHSHAHAILSGDFPHALKQLAETLIDISIPIEEIIGSGGGESKGTQRLRRDLTSRGWSKKQFVIEKTINGLTRESISHVVDHVLTVEKTGTIALEIEWNNKDPFFDRDLENFKRLHSEGAISVGVIITRGTTLQDTMKEMVLRFAIERAITSHEELLALGLAPTARQQESVARSISRSGASFAEAWAAHFVADKYGAATTHWRKLIDRVRRGVGNPCPLLLIGLPAAIVKFDGK